MLQGFVHTILGSMLTSITAAIPCPYTAWSTPKIALHLPTTLPPLVAEATASMGLSSPTLGVFFCWLQGILTKVKSTMLVCQTAPPCHSHSSLHPR